MAPPRWWPFLGMVFLAGILFKVYPLAAFVIILSVITMIATWWRRRALDGVFYIRRPHYRRGFPGEQINFKVEVENRKFLPIPWLRVRDSLPSLVGPADESLLSLTHSPQMGLLDSLFALRWFERDKRQHSLLLRKRGLYQIGPARLESGDMFGIFEQVEESKLIEYLTVFPEPVPFQSLVFPADDPFGGQKAPRRLFEDTTRPMGVRDYHPEDDFRRIHWPATARTGSLQVRVFQPVSARVMVVCLNVSTFPRYWEGVYPDLLEFLVRVSAAIVKQGIQDGYQVGLISNGALAHSDQPFRVKPGRSREQLARLLTVLAGVTPISTNSFDRFLMSEIPRLPFGANLVLVTGIITAPIEEALLRLKRHGWRVTLFCFSQPVPTPIPGVQVFHRPFEEVDYESTISE